MKEKLTKYPKFRATAEPILLAFPSLYMVDFEFSHVFYFLSKQRSALNVDLIFFCLMSYQLPWVI